MRIVLATTLYPPEIAEPAPYIKELAKRLGRSHDITIVAYARLPEQVPGVRIVAINKQNPLPLRLFIYFVTLLRTMRTADVLYAENGASIELPVALATRLTRCPLIIHRGDRAAHVYAQKNGLYGFIERLALRRAQAVVEESPFPRPEIIPFGERPTEALTAYERSWEAHVQKLSALFTAYAKP